MAFVVWYQPLNDVHMKSWCIQVDKSKKKKGNDKVGLFIVSILSEKNESH